MNKTMCGLDCNECQMKSSCKGCIATNGNPYGSGCVISACCKNLNNKVCDKCNKKCILKEKLMEEINNLKITNMEKIKDLNALLGSFVNMEYTLLNGNKIKLLDDNRIYLGNQVCKKNSDRCYGIAADENYILICEYGENGMEPEIIVYKKREQ